MNWHSMMDRLNVHLITQNTYQRKTTLTTKDIILLLFRKQGIAKKKEKKTVQKAIKYKNETKKSVIKNE